MAPFLQEQIVKYLTSMLIEKITTSFRTIKDAIELKAEYSHSGDFYEQTTRVDKLTSTLFLLTHPSVLKKWALYASSSNYGRSLLNQVFPMAENPHQFHSTEHTVDLSEVPIQVLGWKEFEDLRKKGIQELGLNYSWIMQGFHKQAMLRGIDLEWHFHSEPPDFIKRSL